MTDIKDTRRIAGELDAAEQRPAEKSKWVAPELIDLGGADSISHTTHYGADQGTASFS